MDTATRGIAEAEGDEEQGVDEEPIFYRMVFLLAALTRGLCSSILGADDASFRPVMGKRGDTGMRAGSVTPGAGSSSSGTTMVAASTSATPSCCARAVRERAGASPRARSAASSTGKRT